MRSFAPALIFSVLFGFAAAQGSGADSSSGSASPPSQTSAAASASSSPTGTSSADTGGKQCMENLMCITAVVTSTTTNYQLTAQSANPGYMAMGFGTSMINSPMVIMWSNADGNVTLSQRLATEHHEPKLVTDPPRVATLDTVQTNAQGDLPTFAFSIATQPGTSQQLIWAFGDKHPDSADPAATLQYHKSKGVIVLDVSQPGGASGTPASQPSSSSSSSSPTSNPTGSASSLIESSFTSFIGYVVVLSAFVPLL